ncbi:lytic murein transglycosylase [Shewanella mangrovi]|uniref:lytic murein transglycosylase n=1 Tax=Shewanella mangrovi TaxID=1515746 RepID=UPI001F4C6836|nr:lytic murein transglycosylase [Shewanella mangrovi]
MTLNDDRRLSVLKKISWVLAVIAAPTFAAQPVDVAQEIQRVQDEFPQCLQSFAEQAKSQGVSDDTIKTHLANLKVVKRVIELDRRQPEFTSTFAGYFDQRVTDWRVNKGRQLLEEHRQFLNSLTKQYGIPAQYLLAFWGMETNFGGYKGKMPVLDSLATLACDHRRSKFFTKELITALQLSQKYQFPAEKMQGSWAGAMGHTQFMPSAYASYAVDADGDGKADLWSSTEDALASAANFLQHLGWQRSQRWGREVLLPDGFDYTQIGQSKPLVEWQHLGLKEANGHRLPVADMRATLILPAGHQGPAFIGYDNFEVIKRWNRSDFYAISVGHLADRIIGAGKLAKAPPQQQRRSREQIKVLQQKLNELGFDAGKPDGILGSNSRKSLRAFQASKGLIPDGFPDDATFNALGISGS